MRVCASGWIVAALWLALIGCAENYAGSPLSRADYVGPLPPGIVHGNIYLVEVDTGRQRPLDRQSIIEVKTKRSFVHASTNTGGTYRIRIEELGRWPLVLHYRGRKLTVEVGSYRGPNHLDLFIEYRDDVYRLRSRWIDPNPNRR